MIGVLFAILYSIALNNDSRLDEGKTRKYFYTESVERLRENVCEVGYRKEKLLIKFVDIEVIKLSMK